MARFWYIPITFVLIFLGNDIINAMNIFKGNPIISSEYSATWITLMIIIAITLEFVYLFLDRYLKTIFE